MEKVEAWTDGSCHPNPGPGGWGAVIRFAGREQELWGGEHNATNNTMELMAVIQALSVLRRPCSVQVFTDSKYVANGFTQHMPTWRKNDWRTYAGAPVKNKELWLELEKAASAHRVLFRWIRGHVGTFYNERADRLARRGRDELSPYGS